MRRRPRRCFSAALALLFSAVLAAGCRGGGELKQVTTTPAPGTTGTATRPASPSPAATGVKPSPSPTTTLGIGDYTPSPTPTPSARQVEVYRNDAYGFSFSLACPPFCQVDDTALDILRVAAGGDSRAFIDARVFNIADLEASGTGTPVLEQFHQRWAQEVAVQVSGFQEATSGGTTLVDRVTPGLLVEWTATSPDGANLSAQTVLAAAGPVGYALTVGAPPEEIESRREDLDLVLKTFHVEGQVDNVPGAYRKHGFTFTYPAGWEASEQGATRPEPDPEQGQFQTGVRPPGPASVVVLTWNTVSAASFDPARDLDQAITDSQQQSASFALLQEGTADADGSEVHFFLYKDALEDGRAIFAGYGEWFCLDSSRVFTLFYATDAEITPEELPARFEEFTGGFSCS